MTAQGLVSCASVDREHLRQQISGRSIGQQNGELGAQPVQLRGRADVRWPVHARRERLAAGAAEAGQPDRHLAEQRRDPVPAIVLHPVRGAAVPALRTVRGMNPGLRGDDLLLNTGQELLALGQGQAEAGQVGEVVGPGDPQDIGAVLLSLGSEAHQSHDPGHVASTSAGRTGPRIPPSALAPPISRQSLSSGAQQARPSIRTRGSLMNALFCRPLTAAIPVALAVTLTGAPAEAQEKKPNIILILGDDHGYGDIGVYGGGEGRGMPTPNLDRLANEGMQFWSFYAQPSCTPGRAAVQTGRIPNRSGMTTVAFQGQGGGLPAAEWTLGSVLKTAGYKTFFTGKWHLGEADYALPNAQGYDEMRYVGLYHLNAYTYADPTWFPDMDPELRAMFQRVTKGALSGKAGQKPVEEFKINGQYVNTPVIDGKEGVVGIPFFDSYVEKATIDFLDQAAKSPDKPFFINTNFMKVHQPNLPAPEFQ